MVAIEKSQGAGGNLQYGGRGVEKGFDVDAGVDREESLYVKEGGNKYAQ